MKKFIPVVSTIILSLGWIFMFLKMVASPNIPEYVIQNPGLTASIIIFLMVALAFNLSWELTPHRWKTIKELEKSIEVGDRAIQKFQNMQSDDRIYMQAMQKILTEKTGVTHEAVLERIEADKERDKKEGFIDPAFEEIQLKERALAIIDDNLGVSEEFIITNRFATANLIVKFAEYYHKNKIDNG